MHDLRSLRADPAAFDAGMARRGLAPIADSLLALDEERRRLTTESQSLQARRNEASKEIGRLKRDGGDADALVDEVAAIKTRLPELEQEAKEVGDRLDARLAELPNIPDEDVADGADEDANVEIKRWGTPVQSHSVRQHFELGEAWGDLDFEAAAALSGSRFVVVRRHIARLARALGQFMLDTHVDENGFVEVQPPYLVRDHVLFGTGQLPKFAEDLFQVPETGHWLIPTAEVPLTNLAAGKILDEADLPLRMTALTPCFRAEAGSAGRDTRGMIRQHQFDKVELVTLCWPEDSEAEHDRMLAAAEGILQALGLAYRVVSLCTGDLGFAARKTYDIEVWLPGQGQYREISSVSNCGDFQARRMNARCRAKGEKQTRFLHTLNGSGVAVGRALVAVLETYQNPDGSLTVPEALQPYLKGRTRLTA